jgi:hypothetical protein
MLRRSTTTLALVTTLALAACGGEEEPGDTRAATTTSATAIQNTQRYCQKVAELDAAGEDFFAGLGEDSKPEEFEAAERRFVERYGDELEALRATAPPAIRDDVQKVLIGMRQRAGLETSVEVSEAEVAAADERVRAFEERACE